MVQFIQRGAQKYGIHVIIKLESRLMYISSVSPGKESFIEPGGDSWSLKEAYFLYVN